MVHAWLRTHGLWHFQKQRGPWWMWGLHPVCTHTPAPPLLPAAPRAMSCSPALVGAGELLKVWTPLSCQASVPVCRRKWPWWGPPGESPRPPCPQQCLGDTCVYQVGLGSDAGPSPLGCPQTPGWWGGELVHSRGPTGTELLGSPALETRELAWEVGWGRFKLVWVLTQDVYLGRGQGLCYPQSQ